MKQALNNWPKNGHVKSVFFEPYKAVMKERAGSAMPPEFMFALWRQRMMGVPAATYKRASYPTELRATVPGGPKKEVRRMGRGIQEKDGIENIDTLLALPDSQYPDSPEIWKEFFGKTIKKRYTEAKGYITKYLCRKWLPEYMRPSGHKQDDHMAVAARKALWPLDCYLRAKASVARRESNQRKKAKEDQVDVCLSLQMQRKCEELYMELHEKGVFQWYPAEWLAFMMYSTPAGTRAIPALTEGFNGASFNPVGTATQQNRQQNRAMERQNNISSPSGATASLRKLGAAAKTNTKADGRDARRTKRQLEAVEVKDFPQRSISKEIVHKHTHVLDAYHEEEERLTKLWDVKVKRRRPDAEVDVILQELETLYSIGRTAFNAQLESLPISDVTTSRSSSSSTNFPIRTSSELSGSNSASFARSRSLAEEMHTPLEIVQNPNLLAKTAEDTYEDSSDD